MSLVLDRLSVWLPGRGTVLSSVSAEIAGVTLVVGRNGAGATTLLRSVVGMLPPGARVAGDIGCDGIPLTGLTSSERSGVVGTTHLVELPDADVAELAGEVDRGLLAVLGLDPRARVAELGTGQRAALRLLRALAPPAAPTVVLDQPLAALAPEHRRPAVEAIRALAGTGVTVIWAEHLLEDALAVADRVLELTPPGQAACTDVDAWNPRTVPAPPLVALARALELPRPAWRDAGVVAGRAPRGRVRGGARRRPVGEIVATAQPADLRLDRRIDLRAGECLGVVALEGGRPRELDLARRLVAVARGERMLPAPLWVPGSPRVGRLVRTWERDHRLPVGSVAGRIAPLARLAPARPPRLHSTGEVVALAWGLATSVPGPRLLVDPSTGLDPAGRRHVAGALHADPNGTTVLLSHDLEVLSRACHRILLVAGETVVADGAPLAVLDRLPARPQLVGEGIRALHVADLVPTAREALR